MGFALAAGATLAVVASAAAVASTPSHTASGRPSAEANPYDPANGHPYRHGVIPTIAQNAKMKAWAAGHHASTTAATGPQTLSYGGGVDGIGVQSGAKNKVYLVFYGTQWGTQSTDANGNAKFSGDSVGTAGATQQMFKGIGTNNELWSADLTQWCDGPAVAAGATSCPANTPASAFIPYQSGGALAGVWYDNSAASPATATGHQLGVEAVNAAAHFGNTTAASNRNSYYVILSPHGTNPDDYKGLTGQGYCAWHDYNGDTSLTGGAVASNYGDVAFSNQPYNVDQGATCGVGFVNSPGTLDGYTMTLGHEWHEMMADTNPAGGWTNPNSSPPGQENSDECAWLSPGTTGGAANISFGSFGTFAEQASWSNDTNSCAISHPIVQHGGGTGGNTVTFGSQGPQSWTVGTAVSLPVTATDSDTAQTLTYSATGLPAGLSINASSGLISGIPTAAGTGTATVTAKDTTGASGSTTISWTVAGSGGSGGGITNGGFEAGTLSGWTVTGKASTSASAVQTGGYGALVGSANPSATSAISQTFTAPSGSGKISVSYNITCPDLVYYDWATVTLKDNTTGGTATLLQPTCTLGAGWKTASGSLSAGHSYTITLTSVDDGYAGDPTYTYYDNVTVS